jgi:heme-degrading monooxygenase HmoA
MKPIFYTVLLTVLLVGANKTALSQKDTSHQKTQIKMHDTTNTQAFIDKFFVPAAAKKEFLERMSYNRGFIHQLDGFIKDEAYIQTDENGNLLIVTVAIWRDAQAIAKAKDAVFAEYKRIGFNPVEFYERLQIKLERGVYSPIEE